jgi:hypothetical protein
VRKLERDWRLQTATTHTPDFLGLPSHVWPAEGGPGGAGEGIIIGIIDTGIDPSHPSFSSSSSSSSSTLAAAYPPVPGFRGRCELPIASSCNGKLLAAQHFSRAAQAAGALNASHDFASPIDGDGHGRQESLCSSSSCLLHHHHHSSSSSAASSVPVSFCTVVVVFFVFFCIICSCIASIAARLHHRHSHRVPSLL